MAVDCTAPTIGVEVLSEDGDPLEAESIRAYVGREMVFDDRCRSGQLDCQDATFLVDRAGTYRIVVEALGSTVTAEVVLTQPDTSGSCCVWFDGLPDTITVVVPGSTCPELDGAHCQNAPQCATLEGLPVIDGCADADQPRVVGCMYADELCDEALTSAGAEGDDCYVFPDSCVPDGWSPCDGPVPETCDAP